MEETIEKENLCKKYITEIETLKEKIIFLLKMIEDLERKQQPPYYNI
jgi:hypothetical protein